MRFDRDSSRRSGRPSSAETIDRSRSRRTVAAAGARGAPGRADIARLRDVTLDAYAAGDDDKAAKASGERAELERSGLQEAQERLEGSKRAVAKVEAERGLYAAEHVDRLITERSADATAVVAAAEDAIEHLAPAQARWNAVEADMVALLRLAGQDTSAMPRFPERLAALVRDARRASDVSVPPPLPGGHPSTRPAGIPASPKPDPATHPSRARREAALSRRASRRLRKTGPERRAAALGFYRISRVVVQPLRAPCRVTSAGAWSQACRCRGGSFTAVTGRSVSRHTI